MDGKQDELSILARDGKSVKIGGKNIIIRPLVFRKFRQAAEHIGKAVQKLLDKYPDFDPTSKISEQIGQMIPGLVDGSEELVDIIAICADEPREWLSDNMTLEQMSEAIMAIIEVNGVDRMIANFSRLPSMLKKN